MATASGKSLDSVLTQIQLPLYQHLKHPKSNATPADGAAAQYEASTGQKSGHPIQTGLFSAASRVFVTREEMVTRARLVQYCLLQVLLVNHSSEQQIGCFGAIQETNDLLSTSFMQDGKATRRKTWCVGESWDGISRIVFHWIPDMEDAKRVYPTSSPIERNNTYCLLINPASGMLLGFVKSLQESRQRRQSVSTSRIDSAQ